jgi:ParB-like chromosome segregation protein Spo0J
MLQSIPISSIFPGSLARLRRLNPEQVEVLVESIKEIGLQSPISLHAIPRPEETPYRHNGNIYEVVAGAHRLEACKVLGMKEIPALIVDLADVDRRLWEIDENLIRAELTQLERAEHLRARKFCYEQKYPETKHGGDRKSERRKKAKNQDPIVGSCSQPRSFVDDTAEKIDMSRAAVAQSVKRAEDIDEVVKATIRDMPEIADNGYELDALAAVEPEDQKAAVEAVKSGKARNVREATKGAKKRKRNRKAKPAPSDQDIVRREMVAAVKRCQKETTRRLAAIQINCDGNAIDVVVSFHQ